MKSFKNKENTIYIDILKMDGKYKVCVYDYVLLRDVFTSKVLTLSKALKIMDECKEKHNAYIEV